MKNKLNRLIELSRAEAPAVAPEGFDARVLQAIRREPHAGTEEASLWEQIGALLPRLAVATAAVILLCFGADSFLAGGSSLTDSVSHISEQWMFATNGD
jgi:hypothetical protein